MFSRIELELELVEWTQWYVLTSLSWLDETLYARVRKPFRCCDWLSQFSKRNFSWGKLWENLSMYIINMVTLNTSKVLSLQAIRGKIVHVMQAFNNKCRNCQASESGEFSVLFWYSGYRLIKLTSRALDSTIWNSISHSSFYHILLDRPFFEEKFHPYESKWSWKSLLYVIAKIVPSVLQ